MSLAPIFALVALVPVLIGPPSASRASLTARLCGGGEISIPLGKDEPDKPACDPKGCHGGTCRENKSSKLISRKDGT